MSRAAFGRGFLLGRDNPRREAPAPAAARQKFFDDQGRPIDEPLKNKTSPEEMSALEDIDYYRLLRVPEDATPEEVKRGFYRSAMKYHPDRSKTDDTSEEFQTAKKAFAVLSNDRLRRVYDEARREQRLRTVGGRKGCAPGDLEIDAATVRPDALVITCDFCRRPSSDKCGVCQLNLCGPCKFKPHQAPGFRFHWPFINSSKFSLKLLQQQKEREEKERLKLMWYGDEEETRKKREAAFLEAARRCRDPKALQDGAKDWASHFHWELGMYYAWTQDATTVCIAIRLPGADTTKKVNLWSPGVADVPDTTPEAAPKLAPALTADDDPSVRLFVTQEGLPEPILDRRLAQPFPSQEIGMFTMDSLQHCVLVIEKDPFHVGRIGHWRRLFEGDSDYCRYVGQAPYTVAHPEDGWTHVTFEVPPEADSTDLDVRVDTHSLEVRMGTHLHVKRHFREHLTAQRTDSTWRFDTPEGGPRQLLVVLRTFEELNTWGGHHNEERRTAAIPTRAYGDKDPVPLFREDEDPELVMAACSAVLHKENGDTSVSAAALTPDARNYLGVLDGTGIPPPKYSAEKPSINYTAPYPWSQTRTAVEIQIPIPRQYLNAVDVKIATRDLRVTVGGTPMYDVSGALNAPVLVDDSYWSLDKDDAILTINLSKIEVGDPKLREDSGEWKRLMKPIPL